MNKIIPSTKLRVITVHKLWDMACLRKYFWHRVLNLEKRELNIDFWYGGLLGAGFEALLRGKDYEKAMEVEDKRRRRRHIIAGNLEDEMRLQRCLISAFVNQVKHHPEVKRMKIIHAQQKFRVRLRDSRLWFCGTRDGDGTYRNADVLFECKTAKRVSPAYIDALSLDKQIHGYTYARRLEQKSVFPSCCYCIFQKVQKRVKRNQTIDQFIKEIKDDLADPKRLSFYYIFRKIGLGRLTVAETGKDIERLACILKMFYQDMTEEELLDPHNWPKQEDKCHDYKGCEFLQLCKNPKRWKIFMRLFQQRQMLYEEEKKELSND